MKVLITSECYMPTINGVVTSVINLRNELLKHGHEVRILTLSETKHSYEKDGAVYIGSVGAGKIYPGARLTLTRENIYIEKLINWKPDVVHSQSEFSTFLIARHIANKLQIPIVHTYHTVYENYTHYFSPVKAWGKAMTAYLTNKALKHTQCVIAPTEKVYSLLIGYGVKQEIKVVPTGIDLTRFNIPIQLSTKKMLKEKIGIPNDNKVLVSVGRLAKEKNLEEILLYLSQLNRKNFTLLIVGDGPNHKSLEQYAKELDIADRVIFTGMISPHDIGTYYQIGDVFVSASNSETQGLTYIEALANGVPTICRKDPCLENVVKNGVNGWQYESFEQFRDELYFTISRDNGELRKNAIESAFKDFSSDIFAKKIEHIYRDTIIAYKKNYRIKPLSVLDYTEVFKQ